MRPGDRLELTIGAVAHGGHCVARHEGRVVFVRHTLPGEQVIAEVTEDGGGSYLRADAVRIVRAAADRVQPDCPLAVPSGCGGCDWQHVAPAAQRALKGAVISEQLQRLAGLYWPVTVVELPGGAQRWRTRARFAVDGSGRAGFRAHRSHEVIAVRDCPITREEVLAPVLARRFTAHSEVTSTVDSDGAAAVVELTGSGRQRRNRTVRGTETGLHRVAGREWRISARGFWQVHEHAARVFSDSVAELAKAQPAEHAWDLYGGAGLFAARLAEQVGGRGSVTVVESARRAREDGAAALADLPQVHFVPSSVDSALHRCVLPAPDVVVLDPPRKGAGRAVVDGIAAAGPRRVVYVACDPAALARDVGYFTAAGYELVDVRAYDAFPMTHH
ncbi:MAG: class I SAM-dependent RNA methyltransferase, partial [Sciscionella sp.]